MKKQLLVLLFIAFAIISLNAQARKKANKDTDKWRYEIECVGVGKPGTNLLKVWSYSKKPHIAIEQAKKNAVHGIIFKGFAKGANACFAQKALVKDINVSDTKESFFKDFFDMKNGKFLRFVQISEEAGISNRDVLKLKKEYKVGLVVLVDRDALRKYLEEEKIIRGLNSGF